MQLYSEKKSPLNPRKSEMYKKSQGNIEMNKNLFSHEREMKFKP